MKRVDPSFDSDLGESTRLGEVESDRREAAGEEKASGSRARRSCRTAKEGAEDDDKYKDATEVRRWVERITGEEENEASDDGREDARWAETEGRRRSPGWPRAREESEADMMGGGDDDGRCRERSGAS